MIHAVGRASARAPRIVDLSWGSVRDPKVTLVGQGVCFDSGGLNIKPGDSIQAAVNAHPEGTKFVIKAGVHRRQSIRPKSGMSFVGEAGAVLDGENATAQAFAAYGARNVTVRGLRITNYAPPNLSAAIDGVERLQLGDELRVEARPRRHIRSFASPFAARVRPQS